MHVDFYSSGHHESAHRVMAYYYATAVSYYVTLLSPLLEEHHGIIWPHELPRFHDLCDVGLPCPSVWSLSEVMSVAQNRLVSLDSRIFGRGTCGCETKVSSSEMILTQHWYYFLGPSVHFKITDSFSVGITISK